MKTKRQKMYNLIYRIRKSGGVNIDTRKRTIYYKYQKDEERMQDAKIVQLCKDHGFVRQSFIH